MGLTLETWRERWVDLWGRWRPLRAQLTVFAVAHHSQAIGEIVADLTEAVPMALSDAGSFLGAFEGRSRRGDGLAEARAAAEASHKRAEDLALKLLAEIWAYQSDEPEAAGGEMGRAASRNA
jgi:hypothetical protein